MKGFGVSRGPSEASDTSRVGGKGFWESSARACRAQRADRALSIDRRIRNQF